MSGWIGVDFDGTLAEYAGWKGPGLESIGAPIKPMLNRVLDWLNAGREVRIFTARACVPDQIAPVVEWCKIHLGREIPVTNLKDFGMVELWDDRAIQVEINSGTPLVRDLVEMMDDLHASEYCKGGDDCGICSRINRLKQRGLA